MRLPLFPILTGAVGAATILALLANAEETRVTFPPLDDLVHYTTVTRGEVTEHMLTTPVAIDAGPATSAMRMPDTPKE